MLTAIVVLASCGGREGRAAQGSPSATETSSASASPAPTCDVGARTKIELVAKNVHFSMKCLVVPAGRQVTVTLENRDHVNHNFSVYTPDFDHVFTGDLTYPQERFTYRLPPLDAGVYLFQCDIHAQDMSGPLIVE